MKYLATADLQQPPRPVPFLPAHEANGKYTTRLSAGKPTTAQSVDHSAGPTLTAEEALNALMNKCAKIRVFDTRSGRWLELDGDASLIAHLRGLLGSANDSSVFDRLVPKPEIKRRKILNSWKEISSYFGRGVRTVQRYEVTLGLPVRRATGHSRCAVLAFSDELDVWLEARPMQVVKAVTQGAVSMRQQDAVALMA